MTPRRDIPSALRNGGGGGPTGARRLWPWIGLVVVLLATAAVRVRLLDVPLERDEGEYAYAGQLLLEGVPPYRLAYNMKFPGTYGAYALAMAAFGQTVRGVHSGLLVANAVAIVLVFLLARRLSGSSAAPLAALVYAVLSTSPSVLGSSAHATHFVVAPALGGVLLMLPDRARGPGSRFASGILFGVAILAKQHAVFLAAFAVIWHLGEMIRLPAEGRRRAIPGLLALLAGTGLPLVATAVLLALSGVWSNFFFWAIRYARVYVLELGWTDRWSQTVTYLPAFFLQAPVCSAYALGAWVASVLPRSRGRRETFLAAFALASILTVLPGFYFRAHYFVTLLPALALLAAGGGVRAARGLRNSGHPVVAAVPVAILLLGLGLFVWTSRGYFFTRTPRQISGDLYHENPFPESEEIARYLRTRVPPGGSVAVLGSEPQIYFLSHVRSATGYIYMYGLAGDQPFAARMQEELIREVEASEPEFVVFVGIKASWLPSRKTATRVLDWASGLIAREYDVVGFIEISRDGPSRFYWDEAARRSPTAMNYILVARRRTKL